MQFEKSNNSFQNTKSGQELKATIERKRSMTPIAAVPIRQQAAQEAYESVLAEAGATCPNGIQSMFVLSNRSEVETANSAKTGSS